MKTQSSTHNSEKQKQSQLFISKNGGNRDQKQTIPGFAIF